MKGFGKGLKGKTNHSETSRVRRYVTWHIVRASTVISCSIFLLARSRQSLAVNCEPLSVPPESKVCHPTPGTGVLAVTANDLPPPAAVRSSSRVSSITLIFALL
ncbi:hypothetical protein J6590_019212 [Homalodisca vitripennis]|nr:hypothetical protein J6590_019212 [Homalodisca vitripennis]